MDIALTQDPVKIGVQSLKEFMLSVEDLLYVSHVEFEYAKDETLFWKSIRDLRDVQQFMETSIGEQYDLGNRTLSLDENLVQGVRNSIKPWPTPIIDSIATELQSFFQELRYILYEAPPQKLPWVEVTDRLNDILGSSEGSTSK